ncbi:uncharacterized protein LOC118437486 [Folsomia candida]|uniref:uncharacterized protein LOC118437486 n=1 Tax=Folsomia candida TaxID=158441 RepID=UPI001604F710|nr:uncharacterized protein LOC118437486 [Folsomia candida]
MGTGKFVEITAENETLFEDVLKNKLPLTGQLLNVWRLRRQGKFTVENSVKFYIYLVTKELGCVQDIFVLCVQEPNMHGLYSVIIHAPVSPTHEMIKAFEDFVEWDRNPLFPAAPGPFTDAFLKPICLKRGGIPPKEHACEAYALDGDRAMTGQRENVFPLQSTNIMKKGIAFGLQI